MKFNVICIKFDQKIKNLNMDFLGFFRSHLPALEMTDTIDAMMKQKFVCEMKQD